MNNFFSKFFVFFIFLQAQIFCDVTYSTNTTLSTDVRLALSNLANFTATLTLDGAGFYFILPPKNDQVLIVSNSVTATLTNILLQNFSPSHISLGSGSSIVFGSGSYLSLLKNEALTSTLKLSGSCVLDGCSKMISLGSGGVIEAQAGSNITIRDLTIYDVNGTNVRCADNTASITFDNVKIINRNSWSFSTGAFAVNSNLTFAGGGKFVYQSAYASTINDNSTLFLSDAMTFSYDPAKGSSQEVAGQQNLVFTNSSSKMICDGVTLKITNTGMRLTKGTIQFDRKNLIYSDANLTDTAHALILGDGVFLNDPQIILGPDSRISLESGVMGYELVERLPLLYGDSIILRHKAYNIYWYWNPGLGYNIVTYSILAVGSSVASLESEYYVQPGDSSTRWGANFIGNNVLTGDIIRFESVTVSRPYALIFYPYNAILSTPNPPYASFAQGADAPYYIYAGARIYKKGGVVGEKIFKGDVVYIFIYFSGKPMYVGSTNQTIASIYKEMIMYVMPDASATQPPNMNTDFLWEIDTIKTGAYVNRPDGQTAGSSLGFNTWPAASTYQF